MRSIKRAANRILTAGLALCLLLPCAAPAAAALETPDWMLVWSHTRTSSVIAQLEKDQFTAEITVDGVNGVVEMVRSNGKMYLKASKPDGTQVLTLLLREGAAYQLDSSRRLAIHLGDENAAYAALGISGQTVERSLATGKATGFAKAEKTVDGKTYDAEIFRMQLDGKPVETTRTAPCAVSLQAWAASRPPWSTARCRTRWTRACWSSPRATPSAQGTRTAVSAMPPAGSWPEQKKASTCDDFFRAHKIGRDLPQVLFVWRPCPLRPLSAPERGCSE